MTFYNRKLSEVAARWYLKMRDSDVDGVERASFENWLNLDPAHQREYKSVEQTMQQFKSNDGLESLVSALEKKKSLRNQVVAKTILSAISVIAICVASLLGYNQYQVWQAAPVMQIAASNPVGRITTQTLEDGSQVTLSANSDIQVTYYRHQRHLQLNRGEAIFEVNKDADRPFVVETDTAKVTVLGTRFVVNKLSKFVRVSVDHGRVQVESKQSNSTLVLTNGQVAEVATAEAPHRANRNAADAFSFAQGKLVFDSADIDEVAETLSRYRQQPVFAQGHSARNISAIVNIQQAGDFLNGLPNIAQVKISQQGNQTTIVGK